MLTFHCSERDRNPAWLRIPDDIVKAPKAVARCRKTNIAGSMVDDGKHIFAVVRTFLSMARERSSCRSPSHEDAQLEVLFLRQGIKKKNGQRKIQGKKGS